MFKNFDRFASRAKQGFSNFLAKVPGHIQKGQNFLNSAVRHAHTANRLIQHTSGAVQENPLFGQKAKDAAQKGSQLSELGLKRLGEVHGGVNQFADKLRTFQPQPA